MTILIATKRDSCVVLATDRLMFAVDSHGEYTAVETRKLVVHPRYPLAIGATGLGNLPINGERVTVAALVQRIIDGITRPTDLTVEAICNRIAPILQPLVRVALSRPPTWGDEEQNKVRLIIGLVREGRAELGGYILSANESKWQFLRDTGFYNGPTAVRAYLDETHPLPDRRFAMTTRDPERIAKHFRELITGSIAEEARIYEGKNREIGIGVDVAIVQKSRARLL